MFCLSILLLMEVWDISTFWLLWIMLLLHLCACFCLKAYFPLFWVYTQEWNYWVTLTCWGTMFSFLDFFLKEASTQVISFQTWSKSCAMGAGKSGIWMFWGRCWHSTQGHSSSWLCTPGSATVGTRRQAPPLEAVRTDSLSWFSLKEIYLLRCLQCCVSLDRNHRVREKRRKLCNFWIII